MLSTLKNIKSIKSIYDFISISIISPKKPILLGRWALKHDINKCDNYMLNLYSDPGYFKEEKITKTQ